MTITQDIARKTLFTSGVRKNKHNFLKSLKTDTLGFGWSILNSEYKHTYTVQKAVPGACMFVSEVFITLLDSLRSKDKLAKGFDKKLFDLVDAQLRKHLSNDVSTPKFWAMKRGSYETPVSWVIQANFQEVDVTKLASIETTLEEILSKNGYAGNVMVHYRPLRIEVSKPADSLPVFLLDDIWNELNHFPVNQGITVPAMCFDSGASGLYDLKLVNDNRSIFIVGKPGSGKSQIALSLLLSLCYLNNPNYLSMVICDPKADDYLPLSELAHLAMPVITEPEKLLETLEVLVIEMDSRRDRGLKGDRSYKQHLIAVYVDELADIQASLKGDDKQRFITAWQRLAQRGRSAGLIVIGSTQRPYNLDGSLYANLNLKFVGALNSSSESAAIAGKGVITSKLAPGSFEVYPKGDSIRGLFVADANNENYEKTVKTAVQRINKRWHNVAPHIVLEGHTEPTEQPTAKLKNVEIDGETVVIGGSKFPLNFLQAVLQLPEAEITKYQIGKLYKDMFDKELSSDRKTKVYNYVTNS